MGRKRDAAQKSCSRGAGENAVPQRQGIAGFAAVVVSGVMFFYKFAHTLKLNVYGNRRYQSRNFRDIDHQGLQGELRLPHGLGRVNDLLEEGLSTVGTKIDIAHIKASPIGETITAKATLKEIDGRRLVFDVTASDSKGEIANGTHERFIIKVDKFLAKLQ